MRLLVTGLMVLTVLTVLSGALPVVVLALSQTPAAPATQPTPPPPPAVKVGEPAPDFTLTYLAPAAAPAGRPESKQVKLSDFKGKQNVVLAFFPAAFSPG